MGQEQTWEIVYLRQLHEEIPTLSLGFVLVKNKGTTMVFSILIPAYKSRFLKECIDSILAQTVRDFEIVIVDDASPEDLYAIVSGYDDKRIRYYRNDKGFGAYHLVDNWNKCLQYAMGDYVICMGDDDMLAPTCLENYISLIGKYPGLNVYHTRTLIIDENSEVWQIQEQRPEYESGYSLWWHRWNGRVRQYIGDFLYDRAYLMSVGGFYDIPLAWASDDVTAVRAALEKGIANTKEPGFLYRRNTRARADGVEHSQNLSLTAGAVHLVHTLCIAEQHLVVANDRPGIAGDRSVTLRIGMHQLAQEHTRCRHVDIVGCLASVGLLKAHLQVVERAVAAHT